MKKVVGVALLLVVAVFLLPFLIHRGMEQEQAADPAAQEEIALPDSGYTLRILGSDGPDHRDGHEPVPLGGGGSGDARLL